MTHVMSDEVYWLILTVVMTASMWVPYIINRIIEQGGLPAFWDSHGITVTRVAWAERMMRAHDNAVQNLVIFVPLVLLVEYAQLNNPLMALACKTYFIARLAHYLVFTLAIPVLRVFTFLVGFAVQMVLAARLLQFI